MTLLITAVLLVLTGYFSWLAGRRWERGRIELEGAKREEESYRRSKRSRTVTLSTVQIRR